MNEACDTQQPKAERRLAPVTCSAFEMVDCTDDEQYFPLGHWLKKPKTLASNQPAPTGVALQRLVRPRLCDLLKTIKDHPWNRICKTCGKDCSRVAIVKLVYAYEACACNAASYRHLVENVYHAECYAKRPNEKS